MRALLVIALLAAAGCYNPSIGSALLACSADGKCPTGLYCAPDRRCWKPGDNAIGKAPVRVTGSLVGGAVEMKSGGFRMLGALDASGGGSPTSNSFVIVDGVSGQQGRTR